MSYVTLDSLKARFGELLLIRLTDDNNLGVIDEGRVTAAIAAVTGLIDGYLRDRYPDPLPAVPAELASVGEDLALEWLYSCRAERTVLEPVQKRADDARRWLREVQKGTANLSIVLAPSPDGVEVNIEVQHADGITGGFAKTQLDRF